MVKGINYKHWLKDELPKMLSLNSLTNDMIENLDEPQETTDNNAPHESNNETEKELEAIWDLAKANKVVLENHDLVHQELRQEIAAFAGNSNLIETKKEDYKRELEEIVHTKISAYMDTISGEMKNKGDAVTKRTEGHIQDIKEKIGEFKVNISRQLNEFTKNHQAVRNNIEEIRKLKLRDQRTKKGN